MAEKFPSDFDATSPFVPRGRGALLTGVYNDVTLRNESFPGTEHVQTVRDNTMGVGRGHRLRNQTVGHFPGHGPFVSTPKADNTDQTLQQITDMMGRLGAQIGDSIMARLAETGVVNSNCALHNSKDPDVDSVRQDVPQVTVHVKADREPVMFKGDGSDKYSVRDWIDLTKSQLIKQKCPISDQADEIMSRLMGKARDIVKIGLRSDTSLDAVRNPDIIYSILQRYFSDAASCLPLADFYSTYPEPRENPVDYWIRLNKSADLAEEGLRRQGRFMDNISMEVTRMFVKHCPDPELLCLFKCKPIDEWNARDIQRRLDDYQREKRTPLSNLNPRPRYTVASIHCTDPPKSTDYCQSNIQTDLSNVPPAVPSSLSEAQCIEPVTYTKQNVQKPDSEIFSRMMSMLEQVLEKVAQNSRVPSPQNVVYRQGSVQCDVCKANTHTTKTHCFRDRLCFSCFSPGHSQNVCPRRVSARRNQSGGNL